MLTLHLLGHVHVSREGEVLPVSSKAAALLGYLALEGRAHHREHLAGLLWDTSDALRNLRVELTRLKGQGVSPFPARRPMLSLNCATDLESWLRKPDPRHERELNDWLSRLRGPALSGLEDLGSSAFRGWVDQQRSVIHDQIEERLGTAHARFQARGQAQAAALVRARADLLGLQLPPDTGVTGRAADPPAHAAASPSELHFEWPEQLAALRQVLDRAQQAPQLVLFRGHSGTRRRFLADAVQGTPWQAVQVQASSQRQLLQAALAQQLARLLPPELRAEAQALPADPDVALIRLAGLLGQAEVPLLIAVHDARRVPAWLMQVLKFVLDLPSPLVLVLTTTSAQYLADLRRALGTVGGPHQHTLTLPALSVRGVMRAMAASGAPEASDTRHARAAQLVQRSEGWPLHVRALLREGSDLTRGDLRLPDVVREELLAGLGDLPGGVREALARLAQMHDHFGPDLAEALLGGAAPDVLRAGTGAGVLLPAGRREALSLPDLRYRSNDAEPHLAFASEALRSALASTLPAAERHALRCTLAALLLEAQPALSHLYAERAGLTDLAAAARAAWPVLPEAGCRSAPLTPIELVEGPAVQPGAAPRGAGRRESHTPNGYRVALEDGGLEVLRRGRLGPPPPLTLALPGSSGGPWALTARLDVAGRSPLPGLCPPPFALGLRFGTGPRLVYAAEPLPDHEADGTPHTFGGVLPLGRWFRLTGQAAGGLPELSVRAVDVALTVGAFEWGGRSLLAHDRDTLEVQGKA
ncbi:hypothetical protein DEIPH_ctg009orf0027 [Deinococcus phoenicis]|uniref:SARP family transcriptional regulator n=1 Tax=Deinococcus phoenicis TaxID=1476583 RepID=A0A016QU07_9DEIO|nr:hypothetical protein [Deinococcus phoenicis]EYB69284.1 hypothetical protein DEIPH_ctg009orf0027 [Deinococcus phoenicis]